MFLGSVVIIFLVAGFLIILNVNEPYEYTRVPFEVLIILTVIACIAMAAFYIKGPVFDIEGRLESTNINAMLLTVLVIIQISFLFEIISVRYQLMNYQIYDDIQEDISVIEKTADKKMDLTLGYLCADSITKIYIIDEDGTVLFSSDENDLGVQMDKTEYTYSFDTPNSICFVVDKNYIYHQLRLITENLLTVLITSLFFSVETILFMLRLISRKVEKQNSGNKVAISSGKTSTVFLDDDKSSINAFSGSGVPSSLYYIRQIAFLFYFASRLSSAFIPTMAKSLYNSGNGISADTAAGVPQSAEILLTCVAIFATTVLLEKKGWRPSFMWGINLVAAGTLLSGLSTTLLIFVIARAIVGLGYGFCWMTLRNLSLFGKNDKEQLLGFALLNAGIYAGMNCGASFGAILADVFGYKTVFIISATLTIFMSAFILRLENNLLPERKVEKNYSADNKNANPRQVLTAVLFVILMIAPASIAASFITYYLPLLFDHLGKNVTDVGRAQMIYGVFVVYAGPYLSMLIANAEGKILKRVNYIYNLMISLSMFVSGLGGVGFSFLGASLLGTADSFGFGVQNNYFLALPAVKKMGPSRSLSILSFIKKLLEMTGPFVFAIAIASGYRYGIFLLSIIFLTMTVLYGVFSYFNDRNKKNLY